MSDERRVADPNALRFEQGIDAPLEKKAGVERLKTDSVGLRGNVLKEMTDEAVPYVSEDSYNLMKHFGMYQQDDRDVRTERKRAGLDKDWSFMIRTKVPGGLLTPEQYLLLDDCATKYSKGSIRLTTRQTIQFHGVGKLKLQAFVRDLNTRLMTSVGACGDVVRNTMACPTVDIDAAPQRIGREVFVELAKLISERTMPRSNAYFEIFIDGEKDESLIPAQSIRRQEEDLYGATYMPRKFKIAVTTAEDNCVDVLTNDLGLVGIVKDGMVVGYNITVGGGLGHSHSNKNTYPRMADAIAYVDAQHIMPAVDAVITIQRDFGNRLDRKQARLKYLMDKVGGDWFREEMARRMGLELSPAIDIPVNEWGYDDHLGWHEQRQSGLHFVGIFIESGRIIDRPGNPMRSNLRRIVERFKPQVRLTAQQNILLANIPEKHRAEIDTMLRDAGLAHEVNGHLSELRRNAISCVALPTCGLALSEAERAIPGVIDKLEELGHGKERIQIRMSGCPNSCSRAPASEIGLIGRAPGKYNLYVGGNYEGRRLNQLLLENVTTEQVPVEISRLINRWNTEKQNGEAFGDWAARLGTETLKA